MTPGPTPRRSRCRPELILPELFVSNRKEGRGEGLSCTEPGSAVASVLVGMLWDVPLRVGTGVIIDDAQAVSDIAHFQRGRGNLLWRGTVSVLFCRSVDAGKSTFLITAHVSCTASLARVCIRWNDLKKSSDEEFSSSLWLSRKANSAAGST